MNLQSINRTYIDKVFALCDYICRGNRKGIPGIYTIYIN